MTTKQFTVEDMLKDIGLQPIEKQASDATNTPTEAATEATPSVTNAKSAIANAVKEAKAEVVTADKTASAKAEEPIADVIKIAEKIVEAEKQQLEKEAALIGTAIADAVVARLGQFEKAAKEQQSEEMTAEKIAAACEQDPEFAKSFQEGYWNKVAEELEKNPEAKRAYVAEYEKTAGMIVKVGSHMQNKGYVEAAKAVQSRKEAMVAAAR